MALGDQSLDEWKEETKADRGCDDKTAYEWILNDINLQLEMDPDCDQAGHAFKNEVYQYYVTLKAEVETKIGEL